VHMVVLLSEDSLVAERLQCLSREDQQPGSNRFAATASLACCDPLQAAWNRHGVSLHSGLVGFKEHE